jgi:phosphohistidine phosphatase
MRLLVIRHGPAGDRDRWAEETGRPDEERPLTDRGARRTLRAARGLATLVGELDALATSPLVRAVETAGLVGRAFGGPDPAPLDALRPEARPEALLPWLRDRDPGSVVAVVGHDPHLPFLVAWLLTGREDAFVELRKGGAALLEFDDPPAGGNGLLRWLLTPRQLRALG